MTETKFDVVGVGNALVDIFGHVDEAFLSQRQIQKGVMQLIDPQRAMELTSALANSKRHCGGSTANTIASLAQIGVRTGYIGKVATDELGQIFCDDLASWGVAYSTPPLAEDATIGTGRCLVAITPDAERSMNTYLGAAEFLRWRDFDEELIIQSRWIYLEGYRFDGEAGQEAFHQAIQCSQQAGGQVALTLSDPICVSRHRHAFRRLMREGGVDLLFCNQAEILSLFETESMTAALNAANNNVEIVACTRGGQGAIVSRPGHRFEVEAQPVTSVVDATGAGDLFAAGFLFGVIQGQTLAASARMGCVAAAEVIGHVGARPLCTLTESFRQQDLI